MSISLGENLQNGKRIRLPSETLHRHLHLIGASGSGKTTALIRILTEQVCLPYDERCVIIIDRLGGFSQDLLRWFSSDLCPNWVRDRLLYIETADEERCVPLHPLAHHSAGEAYYRTARAMEITLRGWAAQDLSQQPRLARWMFNAFFGAALLGLCIADCSHFLYEHSPFHESLIGCLPPELQREWAQILKNKNQADIQLESTRNRLKPFFTSNILRGMFSSTHSRFDVHRWMKEKKIVIVNLAPQGLVTDPDADTIGGLIVNEVLSIARSLEPENRENTLLVLDEFQRFINRDLELALAESRQLKVQLVLSHQSFSQLECDDVDLTSLIFQCGTRLMLSSKGMDANILADELAGFTFDPYQIKDEIWHRCQRISGHEVVDLQNASQAEQHAEKWQESVGRNWSTHENRSRGILTGEGESEAQQRGELKGGTKGITTSRGTSQTLKPIYEEYEELASRAYLTFEDQKQQWARKLRQLKTGQGLLQIVDDPNLYEIQIDNWAVGALGLPMDVVMNDLPLERQAYEELLERNVQQDCFVAPEIIEAETKQRLESVIFDSAPMGLTQEPAEENPLA